MNAAWANCAVNRAVPKVAGDALVISVTLLRFAVKDHVIDQQLPCQDRYLLRLCQLGIIFESYGEHICISEQLASSARKG